MEYVIDLEGGDDYYAEQCKLDLVPKPISLHEEVSILHVSSYYDCCLNTRVTMTATSSPLVLDINYRHWNEEDDEESVFDDVYGLWNLKENTLQFEEKLSRGTLDHVKKFFNDPPQML